MTAPEWSRPEWMRPYGLVLVMRRGPVDATYLPLDAALTVLYGLNGAGKSLVLDALRDSFAGVVSERLRDVEMYLLAELPPGGAPEWPVGLNRVFEEVTGDPTQDVKGERLRDRLTLSWGRVWEYGWHDEFELKEELAQEFSNSGLFLVRPVGLELPTWELRPAVIPGDHTSASQALLRRLHSFEDEDDPVVHSPVYELWRGRSAPPEAPSILYSESFSFTVTSSAVHPVRLWDDVFIEGDGLDIDQLTAESLRTDLEQQQRDRTFRALEEKLGLEPRALGAERDLDSLVVEVQARANSNYAAMLRDAPALELQVRPQAEWLTDTAVRWVARRLPSDQAVPINWLSHAEQRWAGLAIRLGLAASRAPIMVLDEPEAALHRTAEAYMATAMASLAHASGVRLILSTHSPELLDSRDARRVLVRRRTGDQPGALVPFTGVALEAMHELGLQPSDLLRRTRGFLLVEGEHDLAVLRGWFDRDLASLGVEILPLRGGSKLRTVLDSRFLFDYTDAMLFPFLDDVDAQRVQQLWAEANRMVKTVSRSDATDWLNRGLKSLSSKGAEYLAAFLTRALQVNRESRVLPLGVLRSDILDYLPVAEVVPTATSWQALREELTRHKGGTPPSETEFKVWLEGNRYQARLAPEALESLARGSRPPEEIVKLIDQMRSALDSAG